jgi:hypothetical protein
VKATAVLLSGLPGAFILSVGLLTGGNRNRARRLEAERALLLREADGRPWLGSPVMIMLASF